MDYSYILLLIIFSFVSIFFIVFIYKYKKLFNNYTNLKNKISSKLNINLKNPSDDYIIHQSKTIINSFKEKYDKEKTKRKNIYSILEDLEEGVILVYYHRGDLINIDYANNKAKEVFTLNDYLGKSLTSVVDNHNLIDIILKSFKTNKDISDEILFYSPEKKYFNCKVKLTNFNNDFRIIILTDITKEKNLEELRKEFLTIMSHELRTPLSVINGYLETILMEDNLDNSNKKMLTIIEDESARLTRLVNDLLDLGRLEKPSLENMNYSKINLSRLVQTSYNFFNMLSKEINIDFNISLEDDLSIYGNEDRIFQVIYNLIDNALKFTSLKDDENKNVDLRLYKEKNNNMVEIILEIEDTGIGISSKELQKIFDMFYRIDKSRTRQITGVGLGLYIVKTILDNHKARIYLESEENSGTLFRISFKGV